MDETEGRSVPRRRLWGALRGFRADSRLTREQAAARLGWSVSKLARIELGEVGVSVTDLQAMLNLYGIEDNELVDTLKEAARGSRRNSQWLEYRDIVSPQYAEYLDYEDSATRIRCMAPLLIPGLLQADGYSAALAESLGGSDRHHRVAALRQKRQERLLARPTRPGLEFLIGEEALHRRIGGTAVMHEQLLRLLEMSSEANVSIGIIPFDAGAHAGLTGPFTLLDFEIDDTIVYLEGGGTSRISQSDSSKTETYAEKFEKAYEKALSGEVSRDLLERLAEDLMRNGQARPT